MKTTITLRAILILCGGIFLAGCASNSASEYEPDGAVGGEISEFDRAPAAETLRTRAVEDAVTRAERELQTPAPAKPADPAEPVKLVDNARDPAATQVAQQRVMIYSAALRLTVQDVRHTLETIRSQANALGGYLQAIEGNAIAVRVPAGKFEAAIEQITKLGEVTDRQIKAQDITEEMRDLNIRLDNAEKMRLRLVALLEKSGKMEEMLAVERELGRVTETIEMLKGKIRFLQTQASFSTIRVEVNSPLPQKALVEQIPFRWVRELGNGLMTARLKPSAERPGWFSGAMSFDLPAAYVKYYEYDTHTEAMSAEGVLIKLHRHDNYDRGKLAFWSKLARRSLVDNRALVVEQEEEITLKTGAPAYILRGTRDIAGKQFGYVCAIVSNERYVYTFESWGPIDKFRKDQGVLEQAIRTLDIRR